MYDKKLLAQVAEEFSMQPHEVKDMIELFKDYVRFHLKDFDPHKPLIDQYTGFAIPGIGFQIINKAFLTMDAFNQGLLDSPKFDNLRNYYTEAKLKEIETEFKNCIYYKDRIAAEGFGKLKKEIRAKTYEKNRKKKK